MSETERPRRNFYGRLKGKSLKKSQKTYIDEDLDALSPGAVDWENNPDRTPLDLDTLFDGRKVWLEIGFGGGEHLVHQAGQNPGVGIIGCEPYINGVAMLLGKIRRAGVDNLAIPVTCAICSMCCPKPPSTGRFCSIPTLGQKPATTAAASSRPSICSLWLAC